METGATIFDCAFDREGQYLLAGNSFGRVAYWQLDSFFSNAPPAQAYNDGASFPVPSGSAGSFTAHSNPIYTLATWNDLLITGADEEIRGWKAPWKSGKGPGDAADFELRVPQLTGVKGSLLPVAEINGISVQEGMLYGAAGDGNAYQWDIETGQITATFKGHKDFLHCVQAVPGAVITGSEDGTCKIWDVRTQECTCSLQFKSMVGKEGALVTSCAVDASRNWLVFGGQDGSGRGKFQVCHLPSRVLTQEATTKMSCVQTITILSNNAILCAGNNPSIEHWTSDGSKMVAKVQTTSPSVFALRHMDSPKASVVVAAGAAPTVDVFLEETRTHVFSLAFDD